MQIAGDHLPADSLDAKLKSALNEGTKHLRAKNLTDLRKSIEQARKIAPNDGRVLHLAGLYEIERRNTVQAEKLVRAALSKRPEDPYVMHNLATAITSQGKFEEATELLKKAVSVKPTYAEAYHTLAKVMRFKPGDPLIEQMEKGIQSPNLSKVDVSFYGFALAKALDDTGDPARAWIALEKGNSAMAGSSTVKEDRQGVDRVKRAVTRLRLEEGAQSGHPTRAPIFIVGMPRSGTTLLESVIADHPHVFGAGEVTAVKPLARKMAKNLEIEGDLRGHAQLIEAATPTIIHAGGQGYLDFVRKKAMGWFDYFVDKLPDNSFNLGLISMMLPGSQVVHIMRHPLDIMLSIYFQRFISLTYPFRPEDIVAHYLNYRDIMNTWRDILPLPLIELRYENLVQDRKFAQTLLWEKLGLSLQTAHIPRASGNFQHQHTASSWQVRQPVYQSSREKFRKYEKQMSSFIEAMGGMEAIEAEVADQERRCILRAAVAA